MAPPPKGNLPQRIMSTLFWGAVFGATIAWLVIAQWDATEGVGGMPYTETTGGDYLAAMLGGAITGPIVAALFLGTDARRQRERHQEHQPPVEPVPDPFPPFWAVVASLWKSRPLHVAGVALVSIALLGGLIAGSFLYQP